MAEPSHQEPLSGLLVVNKPAGPSSFRVLQEVRRFLGLRKAGHCGTLDPAASGVLLVLLGGATKRQAEFLKHPKTYSGVLRLGTQTATGDLTGRVISSVPVGPLSPEELEQAAEELLKQTEQTPPMFSALKLGGRRLYELARRGIIVPRSPRAVKLFSFGILRYAHPDVSFRLECSSGTYVRVVAEDFGKALGCGAVLVELVRERVGPYHLKESISPHQFLKNGKEWLKDQIVPV